VSSAEPVRPIDWVIPVRRQAWAKHSPVYSPPWSVWNTTPATDPPRIGGRHAQRRPRQLGVVVGAQREPDTAA
jgi:hypothetical protein